MATPGGVGAGGLGGDDPSGELAELGSSDRRVATVEQCCGEPAGRPGDEGAVADEVEPDSADAVPVAGIEPGVGEQLPRQRTSFRQPRPVRAAGRSVGAVGEVGVSSAAAVAGGQDDGGATAALAG